MSALLHVVLASTALRLHLEGFFCCIECLVCWNSSEHTKSCFLRHLLRLCVDSVKCGSTWRTSMCEREQQPPFAHGYQQIDPRKQMESCFKLKISCWWHHPVIKYCSILLCGKRIAHG